jgi:hypothetical protein
MESKNADSAAPYKRSLQDEIDWKIIDQLHAATATFSSTSLELKKMFLVLIGIAIPSLIKLADDQLDLSLFMTVFLLIGIFWFLDSYTYYYQEKLREKMDSHFAEIKRRNQNSIVLPDGKKTEFTIESNRTQSDRLWRSISNNSLRFYHLMAALNIIGFILHQFEVI